MFLSLPASSDTYLDETWFFFHTYHIYYDWSWLNTQNNMHLCYSQSQQCLEMTAWPKLLLLCVISLWSHYFEEKDHVCNYLQSSPKQFWSVMKKKKISLLSVCSWLVSSRQLHSVYDNRTVLNQEKLQFVAIYLQKFTLNRNRH